jgi:hypothetical protein
METQKSASKISVLRYFSEIFRERCEKVCLGALLAALVCLPVRAYADLGVVIADPTNVGVSAYTHTGHALVYLSGVCAVSPVRARLCGPGERGSVVTTYPDFREQKPYAWNIISLDLYLEGTTTQGDRLLYGSHQVKAALGERARTESLNGACGPACPMAAHSYWRDLVAATIDRDVFIYAVKTTPGQDEAAVEWLNAQGNVNHYNPFTNNCAVFVKTLMNEIFPHSVHRDILNDLGMMSPKSAARSFSRWAHKRPELGFYSMHFPQKPGSVPRSGTASSGTETAIHIKKYLIAAALIGDHEVAGSFFVAYILTGRFDLYKEYVRHSTPDLATLEEDRQAAKQGGDREQEQTSEQEIKAMQAEATGTKEEWAAYEREFAAMAEATSVVNGGKGSPILKWLDAGTVFVDEQGETWLSCKEDGRKVGVGSANVLAEGSDRELALNLLSWRIKYALGAKGRMRPDIREFRQDWALFERAYESVPSAAIAASGDGEVVAGHASVAR